MGKWKVDKRARIENKNQRNVAFCKRRRGLLKKAIEMSTMCGKRVFLVVYDPEKDKAVQFSRDYGFSFAEAYKNIQRLRKKATGAVEFFTNADYSMLELVDLRTLRYNKLPT